MLLDMDGEPRCFYVLGSAVDTPTIGMNSKSDRRVKRQILEKVVCQVIMCV